MRCEEAQELFHAYLDGELAPTLQTELAAHRVQCSECRRALALLEVSGHVIRSQPDTASVQEDFSDRLLACMASPRRRWLNRARWALYVGGPTAAAAVVGLALIGFFDKPNLVAGRKTQVDVPARETTLTDTAQDDLQTGQRVSSDERAEQALAEWLQNTQRNVRDKRQDMQSLSKTLDLTILQWLDILEERRQELQDEAESADPDAAVRVVPLHESPDPEPPADTP